MLSLIAAEIAVSQSRDLARSALPDAPTSDADAVETRGWHFRWKVRSGNRSSSRGRLLRSET